MIERKLPNFQPSVPHPSTQNQKIIELKYYDNMLHAELKAFWGLSDLKNMRSTFYDTTA